MNGALPEDLQVFQGGRMLVEDAFARGERYRRSTFVFPLPNGDSRERVVYFAEDEGRVRMIGFHRILRKSGSPQGETVVFDRDPESPMRGRGVDVPPDSYTYLALCAGLGGLLDAGLPAKIHLWTESGNVVPAEIARDGREELSVLGTRVPSVRVRVAPRGGEPAALYWLAESPPHSFLQYRGPADFLASGADPPELLLRATSSSEQVQRMLEGLEAK